MTENKGYQLPKFPTTFKEEDLLEGFWGSQDPSLINEALIRNVLDLKEVNNQLDKIDREKTKAELMYKHKFRESYLGQSDSKNEAWKRNSAEMSCEKEEIQLVYLNELSKELTRKAQELRARLETLKTISNNIREEMRL